MRYGIKKLSFPCGIEFSPYEEIQEEKFKTYKDAWNYILEIANQETDYLNQDCDDGISFDIPSDAEYNNKTLCKVNYYNSDNDDTKNIEIVSMYWVCECQ